MELLFSLVALVMPGAYCSAISLPCAKQRGALRSDYSPAMSPSCKTLSMEPADPACWRQETALNLQVMHRRCYLGLDGGSHRLLPKGGACSHD